jgi:threonine-phosphate decarboxylase
LHKAEHGGRGSLPGNVIGTKPGPFLDFSVNLNPYPPVLEWEISPDNIRRYPDDEYTILKEVIARHHNRRPEEICVGNGSAEIIRTLCHTLVRPGTTVYIPPHTFSEYALSAALAGAEIIHTQKAQVELSFLCNPDNPSGILTPRKKIMELIDNPAGFDGKICIDEAFIDLADPAESMSDFRHPSVFVLRSLTKSYSMAGVRFGYGIGTPDLITAMEVMRPPWTVNAFAEAMAIQAFERYSELENSRKFIRQERERMIQRCTELGLTPSPSAANYILLDTKRSGTDLTVKMREHAIVIRDCTSFGLPSCVRIAVRTHEENNMLLEAFEKCLH